MSVVPETSLEGAGKGRYVDQREDILEPVLDQLSDQYRGHF